MPNTAPPQTASARRRNGAGQEAAATRLGLPPLWAGASELLAGAAHRVPAEALRLAAPSTTATQASPSVALAGVWAQQTPTAAARSRVVTRTLDANGRLSLPLVPLAAADLAAEADGAVLTVFLPGAVGVPAAGRALPALALDARGRLTLSAGVRRAVGLADGADVVVYADATARTITIVAASSLDNAIGAAIDLHRGPRPADGVGAPLAGERPQLRLAH